MTKTIKLDGENAEQTNEELTKVEEIKDSVFSCVEIDGKYFLALGKYRLSELTEVKQEVYDSVNDTSWERLLSVMHIVAKEAIKEQKDEEAK